MGNSCRQGRLPAGTSHKGKCTPGEETISRTRGDCLCWGARSPHSPAALPGPARRHLPAPPQAAILPRGASGGARARGSTWRRARQEARGERRARPEGREQRGPGRAGASGQRRPAVGRGPAPLAALGQRPRPGTVLIVPRPGRWMSPRRLEAPGVQVVGDADISVLSKTDYISNK